MSAAAAAAAAADKCLRDRTRLQLEEVDSVVWTGVGLRGSERGSSDASAQPAEACYVRVADTCVTEDLRIGNHEARYDELINMPLSSRREPQSDLAKGCPRLRMPTLKTEYTSMHHYGLLVVP